MSHNSTEKGTVERFNLYLVGGYVRDELMGIKSKDIDFCVELNEGGEMMPLADGYAIMRDHLDREGFAIFEERPLFGTIRAHFPRSDPNFGKTTADFVLCRKEGSYGDGRRPDFVVVGDLFDDLSRRDYTVNAIAKTSDGHYIDPWNGIQDIENHILRAVGSAEDRLREDALRALRAIRFVITRDMHLDADIISALQGPWLPPLVADISVERRVDELTKMFNHNTIRTMEILTEWIPRGLMNAALSDGIKLVPSLKKSKGQVKHDRS